MEMLEKFCNIDCPSKYEEGIEQAIEVIKEMLSKFNVDINIYYNEGFGSNIVARIKPTNPNGKIIVSAHIDTFVGFKIGDIDKNPFRIEGEWAYGVGISDCKAGLVSSIYSVRIMQELNMLPNKEIVMIYNCDEEIGSPTAKSIFKEECKDADMAFVFEPSRDDNGIIVQRKGIGIYKINIEGVSAHGAIGWKQGRCASKELVKQINRLYDYTDYENIRYEAGLLHSTESISKSSSATIVASIQSEKGFEMFNQHLKDITEGPTFIDGCIISVEVVALHPAMDRNEKNVAIYEIIKKAGKMMGIDYPEQLSPGSGDACLISLYECPTVDGMGPYMEDIHTLNEKMKISSLKERTILFALTLGILDQDL
ncbi:hypothetical protein AN640_03665 [Candidatus Epulonipiscium fishelsonii]|uniref:Uncharacterized protein n=1 Tax=Candidatus Epulonipiscium fishelsonii TaxID=77094 RepID=A0ACC8XK72_9FIRM|nr:hypothetical protein AN640_03665 [Epulopiscium sp. SCG-D08WGA-EpuloA1]